MACSIGPIHQWIFEQARRAEQRGERLAAALAAAGQPGVAEAWAEAWRREPARLAETPLETFLASGGGVHEVLEDLVRAVCAREAALYHFAAQAGPVALGAFAEALRTDGRELGAAAAARSVACDARTRFASLREHWLEGMPCHVKIELELDEPVEVAWRRRGQPLAAYWELPSAEAAGLAALHVDWMAAFVAAGGGAAHRLECRPWPAGGDGALALRILACARDGG